MSQMENGYSNLSRPSNQYVSSVQVAEHNTVATILLFIVARLKMVCFLPICFPIFYYVAGQHRMYKFRVVFGTVYPR